MHDHVHDARLTEEMATIRATRETTRTVANRTRHDSRTTRAISDAVTAVVKRMLGIVPSSTRNSASGPHYRAATTQDVVGRSSMRRRARAARSAAGHLEPSAEDPALICHGRPLGRVTKASQSSMFRMTRNEGRVEAAVAVNQRMRAAEKRPSGCARIHDNGLIRLAKRIATLSARELGVPTGIGCV